MAVPTAFQRTQLFWNPAALDAALLDAFRRSLPITRADALANAKPRGKAGATLRGVSATSLAAASATLAPTGLGTVFEVGRTGGYPIFPSGQAGFRRSKRGTVTFNATGNAYSFRSKRGGERKAIKFTRGDGGFAAYAIGGDMAAEPYIKPAGVRWAQGGYQTVARASLASRGFGSR